MYSLVVLCAENSAEPAESDIHVLDFLAGHRPTLTGPQGASEYGMNWMDSPPSLEQTRHITRHVMMQY